MSKTTNRVTAPGDGRSVEDRLTRLLDTPLLARIVTHLAPETLHQVIQHHGLEACGELVTSATPTQLVSVLDLDLWRPMRPGRDEQFDVRRFGEWLEVLVDTGGSAAARTVAALDKQVVIAGLSRYLRVFDAGTFEPTASSDDEPADRDEMMRSETDADALECEVGGYLLRARRTDAWDAIVTLLVALDIEHNADFHAVMQGCRRLSHSRPEIDGLDDVLIAPEQHFHDLAVAREDRRSRQGYSTAADARAFLQMARAPEAAAHSSIASNPIVAAYFRATDNEADTTREHVTAAVRTRDNHAAESVAAAIELLTEPRNVRQGYVGPKALLGAARENAGVARLTILTRLMDFVLHHDETAYVARGREMAFLANTLLAGCAVQGRPFTPAEASDAAACICNLGLECWPARWSHAARPGWSPPQQPAGAPPDAFLVSHHLATAFAVGWSVLYRDVSLFAADQLMSTLTDLHCVDADTRRELHRLHRSLAKQREAGTPWRARDAADVLAILDTTAWVGVLGVLDECPIVPAVLTAILEGDATSVSATAFEFISTTAQIGNIRIFMKMLPRLLSR